jgi:hypothetical protein
MLPWVNVFINVGKRFWKRQIRIGLWHQLNPLVFACRNHVKFMQITSNQHFLAWFIYIYLPCSWVASGPIFVSANQILGSFKCLSISLALSILSWWLNMLCSTPGMIILSGGWLNMLNLSEPPQLSGCLVKSNMFSCLDLDSISLLYTYIYIIYITYIYIIYTIYIYPYKGYIP